MMSRAQLRWLRTASGVVPAAAWACALVASLSAISWSFITPPFEVPDEPSHFAYVKQLEETASLPTSSSGDFSNEEQFALEALHALAIRHDAARKATFSEHEQNAIDEKLDSFDHADERGSPAAGVAKSQPPLYYALESIPYSLGSGGTLLDRLQLMRLASALIAGLTALFSFLFLREALPSAPWAWRVGTLGVALSPLFGFMSGGVNPDTLLFAVAAAGFFCLARAFRHGLSAGTASAIGAVTATGLLTKLNFIGLVPGILIGLTVLSTRAVRVSGRSAWRLPVLALGIACSPVALYVAINALSNHPLLGLLSSSSEALRHPFAAINYIWQLYLPRLPGTAGDFPGLLTARQIWFDGYIGQLGWLDTFFPSWVYDFALAVAALLLGMCAAAVVRARATLASRMPELAVYASMALGLMVLIGAAGYDDFAEQTAAYGQTRYLLPLLPLLGAILALSARGAGRRWGPSAGALMVVLFLAHDLFSQMLVAARYYG
jgi:4-amino-4-deoxy-L-arabinose transferase-like glycosyltransferase